VLEPLLVAQFHPAEIEHTVLHGAEDALAAAGARALVERGADAEGEMQSCAAIADLRAGHQRRAFAEAGRGGRAAGALRDVLIDLAVLVWTGPEALYRCHDHARVKLVNAFPSEPIRSSAPGAKFSTSTSQVFTSRSMISLPLGCLESIVIERLFAVQHGEIERILPLHVAELGARDVANTRAFDLMQSAPR